MNGRLDMYSEELSDVRYNDTWKPDLVYEKNDDWKAFWKHVMRVIFIQYVLTNFDCIEYIFHYLNLAQIISVMEFLTGWINKKA